MDRAHFCSLWSNKGLDGEEFDGMMGLVAHQTTGRLDDSHQLVATISYSHFHIARVSQAIIGREQVACVSAVVRHQYYTVTITVTHRDDACVTNHTQTIWASWQSRGLGVAVTIWETELTLKLPSVVKHLHINNRTNATK